MGEVECADSELLDSYKESVRKLAIARKVMTCGVFGVVLIAVLCVWSTASNFFKTGVTEFSKELGKNLEPSLQAHINELGKVLNEAYPVYTNEFSKVFDRDYPRFEQEAEEHLMALEKHARDRLPHFEEEVMNLAMHQQTLIHDNLVKIVGESEADHVAELYRQVIERKIDEILITPLIDHQNVFDQIRNNIDLIVHQEKDIRPPVDLQKAVGMLVEVAGARIQEVNLDAEM